MCVCVCVYSTPARSRKSVQACCFSNDRDALLNARNIAPVCSRERVARVRVCVTCPHVYIRRSLRRRICIRNLRVSMCAYLDIRHVQTCPTSIGHPALALNFRVRSSLLHRRSVLAYIWCASSHSETYLRHVAERT